MELSVGEVYEGKVTGITKFGAFVAFEGGKSGLVHISEVANAFVSDVHDHVQLGQTVRVRVLSIGNDGKINLSIKKAEEAPPRQQERPKAQTSPVRRETQVFAPAPQAKESSGNQDFEDRLKRFMQESDSRIADNRMYSDRRQRGRKR